MSEILSESPRLWADELKANPTLLHQTNSSVLIVRAISTARTPGLQKALWEAIKPHAHSMFSHQASCDILAGLLRYGTMRTCAAICEEVQGSEVFAPFKQQQKASPSRTGRGGKKQTGTASASSASDIPDAEVFTRLAPFVEAAAFRLDIDERQLILAPLVEFLSSIVIGASAPLPCDAPNAEQFFTVGSSALRCVFAILGEKIQKQREDVSTSSASFGDQLVSKAFTSAAGWVLTVTQRGAQQGNSAGNSKAFVKVVQRAVEAAKESEQPARVAAVSRAFFDCARTKVCAADATTIRVPFLNALLSRQKGCPVGADVALFVNSSRRADLVAGAFTQERNAHLLSGLLNCLSASDAQQAKTARELAGNIIAAVQDWPALISAAQVPQSVLGLFMALRHVTQRCPDLIVSPDMATVIDVATRQYLKQTLGAADVAQAAAQMRSMTAATAAASSGQQKQQQQQQQRKDGGNGSAKSKFLKVVDSDDDDDEKPAASSASKAAQSSVSRRRDRDESKQQQQQPSPKNSATRKNPKK